MNAAKVHAGESIDFLIATPAGVSRVEAKIAIPRDAVRKYQEQPRYRLPTKQLRNTSWDRSAAGNGFLVRRGRWLKPFHPRAGRAGGGWR